MARSLSLALYLLTAARGAAGPVPQRAARPEGRLVWLHLAAGASAASLRQLASQLRGEDATLAFLVTSETRDPHVSHDYPVGTVSDFLPPDRIAAVDMFLDHWRPDLAVMTGTSLPPATIVQTERRGIPLVLADVRLGPGGGKVWEWRKGMVASLLARFTHLLVQDPETAHRLEALGGRQVLTEVTGRIEETTDPLPYNETERAEIVEGLRTRPVWLAVACPETEEAAIFAAHAQAMQHAHRMLLIVVPAHPAQAAGLADRAAREGWVVARRAAEEPPDQDVQVYIVDDDELGLWYRIAPVTYMGGTLFAGGTGRSPFEPAALGSAILHGPHPGPYPDAYARLGAANATRPVASPEALAAAVCDLISPDKAAQLAHNAWAMSSGGAEVTERVVRILLGTLATRDGREAA